MGEHPASLGGAWKWGEHGNGPKNEEVRKWKDSFQIKGIYFLTVMVRLLDTLPGSNLFTLLLP